MKTRVSCLPAELCLLSLLFFFSARGQDTLLHHAGAHEGVDTTRAAIPDSGLVVEHGLRTINEIALTFDACSTHKPGGYDDRVTKVLIDTKTPATIFLGGKWMLDQEEHTRLLASLPQFELGNHTFSHPHMTEVSDKRIRAELQKTEDLLFKLTGRRATLFRPPYGEYDSRVVRIASELGLTAVEYDLPSGDPDTVATRDRLISWVTRKARPGSIIVMHINKRGWHTAEALPEIITRLRARGFTFVTVSKLMHDAGLAASHP